MIKPEKRQAWNRWTKYRLTDKHVETILAAQRGNCPICGCDVTGTVNGSRQAVVDHCHISGRVRGILCSPCNQALGVLGDYDGLKRAIDYLENPPVETARVVGHSASLEREHQYRALIARLNRHPKNRKLPPDLAAALGVSPTFYMPSVKRRIALGQLSGGK